MEMPKQNNHALKVFGCLQSVKVGHFTKEEDGISLSVLCLICDHRCLHIVYTLATPEPVMSKEAQPLNERRANSWVGPGNLVCSMWMMTKSSLTGHCGYSFGHMEETVKLIWT